MLSVYEDWLNYILAFEGLFLSSYETGDYTYIIELGKIEFTKRENLKANLYRSKKRQHF